ncbi:MAG: bifunctional homocysteine S-methyltransferase/methylenetetrahydrofolate reductase [Anaerolineae bacterium]|nr:bifunctional homocysteine S-methyltransferase/methylenetetrahydrofolate reductase [Anaerolineae bacterium]
MNREQFCQLLAVRPYLLDGAMGTYLHSRGVSADHSFENVNLQQPALVAEVHRHYIEAGADIIETNTFSANRFKLAEHGLQEKVAQINQTAVNIARRSIEGSFKPVLLAGSVGPLGVRLAPLGRVTRAEAQAAFHEQIAALISGPLDGNQAHGVDLLVLETMSDMYEVETAVTAARTIAPHIPIVATLTFTRDDRTLLGYTADAVARQLAELDIDVMGVNCSGGPAQVLRLIMRLRQAAPDRLLAAMPNAGWPEVTAGGGRVLYPATPDYFGEYALKLTEAGANIIGGCCGTTEAHIAAMRRALNEPRPAHIELPPLEMVVRDELGTAVTHAPTQLADYLQNQTFVVTVEMRPPRGITSHRLLHGAHMLQEAGANILNIADTPVAQMRMSAWAAAYLVQKEIGLETVLHFPTRGRNLLRIQGDLLAAHALGIRNLFVTMGDPTRIGDYPEAMDSYDIVPTGLIQLIKQQFNAGLQHSGASIDEPTSFVVGCALSLTPPDPEKEAKLLYKKIQNGADFALSQPVFDPVGAKAFVELYETMYDSPMIPIVAGMYPLFNGRNAEFLHNEVPGMSIPDALRQRMHSAANPQQEGVLIAQEILAEIRPFVQGVYMMPAFGRYDLVADVLDGMG